MKNLLYILLAAAFALFAYWNLNDADPWLWVPAYGLVALLLVLAALGRADRRVSAALAVLLGLWALTMLPGVIAWFRMGMPSIVEEMQATKPHIEQVREFLGLGIAVLSLVWLTLSTPLGSRLAGAKADR